MQEILDREAISGNSIDGDLLSRQKFIDQVKNIIETLAAQKKNSCFAINGGWGIGKSFVIDILEKQLEEIQDEQNATNKYLVFHYNCWQYDYYDEPIVAIVAAMLDMIDEKVYLLPGDCKTKLKGVLKAIGNGLLHKTSDFIQDKSGVNVDEIIEVVKEGSEEAAEKIEEKHAYDANFIFKKALTLLQTEIEKLAEQQTVIFVVDELDRCLPQYSIKVLERLHHIFSEVSNVQVVMSIDKTQLTHTIEQIFGKGTDVNKYLAKSIKFEVDLDSGIINTLFDEKFAYYLEQFNYQDMSVANLTDIEEFKYTIFKGIDIRSCIEIIDKCNLLHGILTNTEIQREPEYMCVEIFLVLLKHFNFCESSIQGNGTSYGMMNLIKKLNSEYKDKYISFYADGLKCIVNCEDVWGTLLAFYRKFIFKHDDWITGKGQSLLKYATEFWGLLQIIN